MLNKVKYIYRLLTAASASRNCRLWQEKKYEMEAFYVTKYFGMVFLDLFHVVFGKLL